MRSFREALQGTDIPITAEIYTPEPPSVDEILRQASLFAGSVDAIQLAENPQITAQIAPLALARILIRNGIDAVPRISCRDHNRIALQSDLLGLRALGVSSLVVVRQQSASFNASIRPVFDVNCRELVSMAQALNEEVWQDTAHEFVIGTDVSVLAPTPGREAEDLVLLASSGARFLQTGPNFDPAMLKRYMQGLIEAKLTWKFSVIVTVAPLPSVEMARWLKENNQNAVIPDAVIDRLSNAVDPEREGIEICAGLMRDIARLPGVTGFNLLSLGNPESVVTAIKASGLRS